MNKIFHIIFLLSFGLYFSQINVDEIKKKVTEEPQTYFYNYLEIFRKDPASLTREQMNQLYYGSCFVKSGYGRFGYNKDYETVWKYAKNRMSKHKAQKIITKAEERYAKNPLDKEVLHHMSYIYGALNDTAKRDLCISQYQAIVETIEKSGTGESEDSPICVIHAGDMINRIKGLMAYSLMGNFDQKMKTLPDGSMLTTYSVGNKKIIVKLVGGLE
ncbi:hypothetical protein HNP38_002108 [Chryseobacterium defluvii]|uniref:DUF4919 domain-containing protein n=1 Tax=Chryseobacterium defluvii TaxID=160396 RepID=A0A840KIV1_9FLAO|nr:DUF4919 domain-containing protein [Chryseobacterium defluvii]MBB4806812.1 hypothetical protein [Chryseobacterium defluvii]